MASSKRLGVVSPMGGVEFKRREEFRDDGGSNLRDFWAKPTDYRYFTLRLNAPLVAQNDSRFASLRRFFFEHALNPGQGGNSSLPSGFSRVFSRLPERRVCGCFIEAEKRKLTQNLTFNLCCQATRYSVRQWSLRKRHSRPPSLPQFMNTK
jgi:hypothetical protein